MQKDFYIEIIKYLHRDEYQSDPPAFNERLFRLELPYDALFGLDSWMTDNKNAKLFMSWLFVKFNWVMNEVVHGNPDLGALTDLQFKLESVRGKFKDPMMNHYSEMLYALTATVTLRFSDKSNAALAEFNKSMGKILSQAAEWWTHDYNQEYMMSKAPKEFLERKVPENACGECSTCGPSKDSSTQSCSCDENSGCPSCYP
jgi:hypothetical protein